jgi:hypothetical protein
MAAATSALFPLFFPHDFASSDVATQTPSASLKTDL